MSSTLTTSPPVDLYLLDQISHLNRLHQIGFEFGRATARLGQFGYRGLGAGLGTKEVNGYLRSCASQPLGDRPSQAGSPAGQQHPGPSKPLFHCYSLKFHWS